MGFGSNVAHQASPARGGGRDAKPGRSGPGGGNAGAEPDGLPRVAAAPPIRRGNGIATAGSPAPIPCLCLPLRRLRRASAPHYFKAGRRQNRPDSSRKTPPRELGVVIAFWPSMRKGLRTLVARHAWVSRARGHHQWGAVPAPWRPIGAKVSESLPATRAAVKTGLVSLWRAQPLRCAR